MSRKERVHGHRKRVFEVVEQSGLRGITKADIISRISGIVSLHQISESLDHMVATKQIVKLGLVRYASHLPTAGL